MSDKPNTGPNLDTLRVVRQMFNTLRDVPQQSGGVVGRGKVMRPRKVCNVCGKLWDTVFLASTEETTISTALCDACEPKLKEGLTAFICGTRYAFVNCPEALADMRGQVVSVKPHVMEQLEAEFEKHKQKRPKNDQQP